MRAYLLAICAVLPAAAQTISVYSEFTRIDPFGAPVEADRGRQAPREILSPAIPRNAVTSFHVVVEGGTGEPFSLQIAQNPENAVRVTAYRERYGKVNGQWIPDVLEPVKLPYDGRLATPEIDGQTAQAFWIDVMPARDTPVQRIKVEPQVYIDGGWIRYPMEVRVARTALGAGPPARVAAETIDIFLPSSAPALAAWRRSVCDLSYERTSGETPLTIRSFIARNAAQDVRLAGGSVPPQLLRIAGAADRASLCAGTSLRRAGAEEYLLLRDALIGARQ